MKVSKSVISKSSELSESGDDTDFMREMDDSDGEIDTNYGSKASVSNGTNKRKVTDDDDNNTERRKKKKLDSKFYKPPTVDELNQLRETENLFHSNLFRLQIEEVLNEVKIKNKYTKLFEKWFENFVRVVESIEETGEFEVEAEESPLNDTNVCIPVGDVPSENKATFKFLKPSNVGVVGSYSFGGCVGPNVTIDVMVEMPSKSFQKRDYQNYRYFRKKALYMAYIASNIKDDIAEGKSFVGDNLRPILKIVPSGKLRKYVVVHVHISARKDSFKLQRFLPEKNSVRPAWFMTDTAVQNEGLTPTPHYNSIVLHDLMMSTVNAEIVHAIKGYPNIRDGIVLLKIWLKQREISKGRDAFNGHIITMYVLYLLRMKKINTFMSSYQIVRNVWNCLVQSDWTQSGISMCQDEECQKRITEYHKYYDCVFLDNCGYDNIVAHLTKETFSWVQREARTSLKHLDDIHVDSFQGLFMRRIPFYMAFDSIVCIHDTTTIQNLIDERCASADKLNYGTDKRSQAMKIITAILKEGLGKRVRGICCLPGELHEWQCTDCAPEDIGKIIIGLELDPDYCFAVVEKGPEANLPEADAFRKFWRERSELRRFQDGSIREAVVWGKGKTLCDKRQICKRIVIFLFSEKLNFPKDHFTYVGHQMESLLRLQKIILTKFPYGTGEEAILQVLQVLNSLEKELMSLTDVPLPINGVQGSSAVFRYTDVFPPLATVYKPNKELHATTDNCLIFKKSVENAERGQYVQPMEVTLQLSASGKWPDELEALRKTKAAFHLQIAECLRQQCNLKAQGNIAYVDVFKEGFVFRLRVAHPKETALMKQEIGEDGVTKYRDTGESVELENQLFHLPKLSSAIHGLHSQQPSYGAACRLAKRWLSAQLLDDSHIPDIVVELLLASIYLTPAPHRAAQIPQLAFLRLLELFQRGLWRTDPAIVNFNDEMTKEEIVAIENLFGTARDTLPALFISTPYDQQKSLCTRKAPSPLVLNRISVLAKESLKLYEDEIYTQSLADCKAMFRPALSEYDYLIYLNQSFNPRELQAIDVPKWHRFLNWHPYKHHSEEKIPIVDFNPVQRYLRELRDGYDEFALFFYNTYGGDVIGVLLKPNAVERREFKISNLNCRKLDSDGKLIFNLPAMIQDFRTLGKDVVRNIVEQTKRSLLT